VLLCWNELSFQCQNRILAQASDVIGLTPLPGAPQRDRQAAAASRQNLTSRLNVET